MPATLTTAAPPPATAPHPRVYLCQVSNTLSCGACCGLYNVADLSREALTAMLTARTAAFHQLPRTADDIDAFAERQTGFDPVRRPFPDFHHCPFVGLIDGRRRVGCLLHPLAEGNDGVDWRGLSYYGGMACATYFCPSTRRLHPARLSLLREAFDDWYDYGLLVTERRLLTAVFAEMAVRLGYRPGDADAGVRAAACGILRRLSALHRRWPYRPPGAPGPANYFFENGEYERPAVAWADPGAAPPRYAVIFRELESVFETADDQRRAGEMIDDMFR